MSPFHVFTTFIEIGDRLPNNMLIRIIPESLIWESGHQVEWDIWKDWHKDAAQSTGIQKAMETFEVTVTNSDLLKFYFEDQLPYYENLYAQRILPLAPA